MLSFLGTLEILWNLTNLYSSISDHCLVSLFDSASLYSVISPAFYSTLHISALNSFIRRFLWTGKRYMNMKMNRPDRDPEDITTFSGRKSCFLHTPDIFLKTLNWREAWHLFKKDLWNINKIVYIVLHTREIQRNKS